MRSARGRSANIGADVSVKRSTSIFAVRSNRSVSTTPFATSNQLASIDAVISSIDSSSAFEVGINAPDASQRLLISTALRKSVYFQSSCRGVGRPRSLNREIAAVRDAVSRSDGMRSTVSRSSFIASASAFIRLRPRAATRSLFPRVPAPATCRQSARFDPRTIHGRGRVRCSQEAADNA